MNTASQLSTSTYVLQNCSSSLSELRQGNGTASSRTICVKVHLAEEVFLGLVIYINVYLFAVAIWYAKKHGKATLKKTNIICCVLALLLLVRSLTLEVRIRTATVSTFFCNFSVTTLNFIYGFNRTLPYILLWMRQRTIYIKLNKGKTSKLVVQILSWSTLIGIILFEIILTAVLVSTLRMKSTSCGCVFENPKKFLRIFNIISPTIFGASTVLQLLLLALVLYPLVSHIRTKIFYQGRFKKTVIRLGVCTFLCIISDLLFLVTKYVKPPGASSIFTLLCSCYNNDINLMAVLFTFGDSSRRYFPWLNSFGRNAKVQSFTPKLATLTKSRFSSQQSSKM